MKTLESIFAEEAVTRISEKILQSTKDKIKEQIAEEFFKEVEIYLFEIYDKFKEKIETDLIKEITEEYILTPDKYKYAQLRKKMFLENKELFIDLLTDEMIQKNIECVILQYTADDYYFSWRWKDGIGNFILNNIDMFENDERVISKLTREITSLKLQLSKLKSLLKDTNQ